MRLGTLKRAAAVASMCICFSFALGQDPQRGARKSLQCAACHGPVGVTQNPMFPHLAGQNATYLEIQLENFRSGQRYHPLMTPIAESLSAREMRDLAAYFSSIGPLSNVGGPQGVSREQVLRVSASR